MDKLSTVNSSILLISLIIILCCNISMANNIDNLKDDSTKIN